MALLCAFTGCRPGTIIESSCPGLTKTGEALKWRDVELYKAAHPDPMRGVVLFIKVTLRLMKGKRPEDSSGEKP